MLALFAWTGIPRVFLGDFSRCRVPAGGSGFIWDGPGSPRWYSGRMAPFRVGLAWLAFGSPEIAPREAHSLIPGTLSFFPRLIFGLVFIPWRNTEVAPEAGNSVLPWEPFPFAAPFQGPFPLGGFWARLVPCHLEVLLPLVCCPLWGCYTPEAGLRGVPLDHAG